MLQESVSPYVSPSDKNANEFNASLAAAVRRLETKLDDNQLRHISEDSSYIS